MASKLFWMIMDVVGEAAGPAGRSARSRHEKRIAKLQSLVDTGVIDTALEARHRVWNPRQTAEPVPWVVVRSMLVLMAGGRVGSNRLQELSTSRGAAVQVLLLALFEAQVRRRRSNEPPGRTRLPIRDSIEPAWPSWVDFTALPTTDSTKSKAHARTRKVNRERQLKRALDILAKCGRIELKPERRHGRYEQFRLLDEGVDNKPGKSWTYYSEPSIERGRARRKVITVPVGFFLNGWVDALSDNEIITYLALRLMAQAFPKQHASKGVFLSAEVRQREFNLDRGFEAHRMLSRYGLIHAARDERRRANGTIANFEEEGAGELHRFSIDDNMLTEPAVPRVIKSLTRFADGFDYDEARMADIYEEGWPDRPAKSQ